MRNKLRTGELALVTGLAFERIKDFHKAGLITPVGGGRKRGRHCYWSAKQALGLAVGEQVRRSERGCMRSFLGKLVTAFQAVDISWLEAEFEQGHTHLVTLVGGLPVLRGKAFDRVDVQAQYKRLKMGGDLAS